MPCCTYLDDDDISRMRAGVTDREINDTLAELNAIDGDTWTADERVCVVRPSIFARKRRVRRYTLYAHTVCGEYQVINFANENAEDCGILPFVSRAVVLAYLTGILEGRRHPATKGA